MSASESTQVLDDLLDTLSGKLQKPAEVGHADEISAVLSGPPRSTEVVSLHDSPVVEAFRQALTDGLIRADTANQLLRLVNEVIVRFAP